MMQPSDEARAIRELTERAVGATLQLGELPEAIPVDVPVPLGGRILGSLAHPPLTFPGAPGPLTGERFEVFLDAPGAVTDLVEFYEQAFAAQGWTVPERQWPFRQRMAERGHLGVFNQDRRSISVQVQSRGNSINSIRVSVSPVPGPASDELRTFYELPQLRPPSGG